MIDVQDSALPPALCGPLPCLTADLPGVAGRIKVQPEDFLVEEIPAYEPCGDGEFLYLWIEKQGLSAEQLVSHLARDLAISHQEIGAAGMKDRHAVTRQWISVPAKCEPLLPRVAHEAIQILEVKRHRNKLRPGHLRGNRFNVLIRDVSPDAPARAQAIGARLAETGFPNYFGDQRFGRDDETLKLGLDLLRGEKRPGAIPRARRKFLLRLALSAVQSALFNRALAERLTEGLIRTVLPGDVMQVVASGGPFIVDDVATDQARCDAGEIVVSGPMFGPKMKQPAGAVAARENRLLEQCGLNPADFSRYDNLTSGTRRPYLVKAAELQLSADPAGLRVEFVLPSGCYATVLLRELQK
jgi:tRNA pseudouridine13 synthase